MFSAENTKAVYQAPVLEASPILPDLLCDSLVDGSLEGVGEEDWTI